MTDATAGSSPPTAGTKILLADDDESLVRTLSYILKERGYEVIVSLGGENLLALVAAEKPQLLLLDIMMPKTDGMALLEQLKEDERFKDLPVLMLSSMPPEDATVKALGLGAADFIPKPVRAKELFARIEAHLRVGRSLGQAREEQRDRKSVV